jgi:hypothetical protein
MSEHTDARNLLVEWLRAHLIGPHAGESETLAAGFRKIETGRYFITQTAADFYHTGFLSPVSTGIEPEEDEQDSQGYDADQGLGENIMTLSNAAQQSAMGVTFQLDNPAAVLSLRVSWGEYQLAELPQDGAEESSDRQPVCWQRNAVEITRTINIDEYEDGGCELVNENDISVRLRVRSRDEARSVTIAVINGRHGDRSREIDARIYQVAISVDEVSGSGFLPAVSTSRRDEADFWDQELRYRNHKQYAVGHGCAADWNSNAAGIVNHVFSMWVPQYEVPKAAATSLDDSRCLSLDWLANAPDDELSPALESIADDYETWIENQKASIESIVTSFPVSTRGNIQRAADDAIVECEEQCNRIREGVKLLGESETARDAFRLANNAMARAMLKSRPDAPSWFTFQLAFILLTIPSIVDRRHSDRRILDLIWFPTGGGKTEAYLGLTAFTIFYRSLLLDPGAALGTIVLTRYTLRLLTIQQFERAALTIVACELVRRTETRLSQVTPYSIGLLVGKPATPNKIRGARELLAGNEDSNQTLLPLERCPWCGTPLTRRCVQVKDSSVLTTCPNNSCEFHDGLPIVFVDEQIYAECPTFVIATIDKFAQMAWEPDIGRLFGRGVPERDPPELIIQDELHLISDSLGTIAALYESAIDFLCSREDYVPKIVGSTATIRRAYEQCLGLFDRVCHQFPPGGLDAADSFFYKEDSDNPGRLYVGVHAQGRSPKHTWPRVIGTIAQATDEITDPNVRDKFYTLVAYFNSLRELGGSLVIAEDDVPRYIDTLAKTRSREPRILTHKAELTSVIPSKDIPVLLRQMETSSQDSEAEMEALDLVLCTNMISVGVDVGRLGVMIVAGQPKTTAEYIQATSRVGRLPGTAGLVITQYNWTRPRDRSHYERFVGYHSAFYRYVEAVSVTPFSSRARDRALASVLVGILRIALPELSANEAVKQMADDETYAKAEQLLDFLFRRVESVDSKEAEATKQDLRESLATMRSAAEYALEDDKDIYWIPWAVEQKDKPSSRFILYTEGSSFSEGEFASMLSMRDVDLPSRIRLLEERT